MDAEREREDDKLENGTGSKTPEGPSNDKDNTPITVGGNGKAGGPAKMAASDREESPLEENRGNEPHNIATSEHMVYAQMGEVDEQPATHQESVVLEISSSDDYGIHELHLGTSTPALEDEEELAADATAISCGEYARLLRELREERDRAAQRSRQLQARLHDYLQMKAGDDTQQRREAQVSGTLQDYEKKVSDLTELKQQMTVRSETAQQQAEELRLQSQERLDEVANEWRAVMALKQVVGVKVLSRSLGKQAAQAEMESTLAAEQLRQDQLIKLQIRHIKLRAKIESLEAELHDEDNWSRDPLHLHFELLQAERLEQKKRIEKQREEWLKLQKKISSILELLSNIKEKLYWSQTEVQAKRELLAEVEALVARKRDHLTRTKQVRNSLQRDNQRLKEHRGLLGNRVLLRDFEDTVDATDHLEEQVENLKCQQSEISF